MLTGIAAKRIRQLEAEVEFCRRMHRVGGQEAYAGQSASNADSASPSSAREGQWKAAQPATQLAPAVRDGTSVAPLVGSSTPNTQPPPPQCGPMGGSKLTWDDLPTKRVPLVLGTSLAEAVAVLSRQNDSGSQHVSPARGVPAAPAAPLATPPRLDNPSVTTTEQESWKPRRSLAVANLLN